MIFYLPVNITKQIEERHWKDVSSAFEEWIINYEFPLQEWKDRNGFLTKEEALRKIVLAKPEDFITIIESIHTLTGYAIPLKNKNHKLYTNFRNRKWALELLQHLNVKVCPYCNRQYVHTVTTKNNIKVISPHFDHFYPKSLYPFLQVSLYNLIPSCATCNLKKSDEDPTNQPYPNVNFQPSSFHPYIINAVRDEIVFKVDWIQNENINALYGFGKETTFQVKLEGNTPMGKKLADYLEEKYGISEVMSVHQEIILSLIQKIQVYDRKSIEYIEEKILNRNMYVTDTYHFLFGDYLDEAIVHERPLGKLQYDLHKGFKEFWDNFNLYNYCY